MEVGGSRGQNHQQLDCLADVGAVLGNEGNKYWNMKSSSRSRQPSRRSFSMRAGSCYLLLVPAAPVLANLAGLPAVGPLHIHAL